MNQIAAIKAPLPVAETAPSRQPAVSASAAGVKTADLAPENTVSPPQRSEAPRPRTTRAQTTPVPASTRAQVSAPNEDGADAPQPVTRATIKNIEFNSVTRDVIFQSLSEDTGEIVTQVPSEALLRIREYVRGQASAVPSGQVSRIA